MHNEPAHGEPSICDRRPCVETQRNLSSAIQGINTKLAPEFARLYKVTKKLGQDVYEVEDGKGVEAGKLHVVDLKEYVTGQNLNDDVRRGKIGRRCGRRYEIFVTPCE